MSRVRVAKRVVETRGLAWTRERERERDGRREKKRVFAGSTSMDSSIRPFGRRARFRQLKLFIKRLPVESKHVERERERREEE